jgi:hypothetical protein
MSRFGPTSAPVANCGVLEFSEASGSYKIDYNRRITINHNRRRTFETQFTHSVTSGPSRTPCYDFRLPSPVIVASGSPKPVLALPITPAQV